MTKTLLLNKLKELEDLIEDSIDSVDKASLKVQQEFYEYLLLTLSKLKIENGRFVVDQDMDIVLGRIQSKFETIINSGYKENIKEYLSTFRTIQNTNISLHKSYNDLEVEVDLISPARRIIYNQARTALGAGLNDIYLQPFKYLLMQQVTSGSSIKDSQNILKRWNEGHKVGTVNTVPNLNKYSLQIARDSSYGLNRAVNDVIANKYGLTKFLYVGALLKDSRPICVHLVNLDRDISLDEMPPIIKKYPQGLRPNTTKDNFMQVAGGFNCNHTCFPVS